MPTILTHTAVPLAMAMATGRERIPRRLLVAGVIVSMLPDLDVLAFRLGIPYAAEFGHRGFTHSLLFALLFAIVGAGLAHLLRTTPRHAFWFLFAAMASHGMLDAFTNGGMGIAFLWPVSDARFFAPFQPIQVSPIGFGHLLTLHGLAVLRSELLWVWFPCFSLAILAFVIRRWLAVIPGLAKPVLKGQTDDSA